MLYGSPSEDAPEPSGVPKAYIKLLREFPDYQIDVNHNRCGIKGKLINHLDVLERMINDPNKIGICLDCWQSGDVNPTSWSLDRHEQSKPYQGILSKDVLGIQKLTEQRREELQLPHELTTRFAQTDFYTNGATDVNGNAISSDDEAEQPRMVDFRQGKKPSGRCVYVYDHELYASVFSPEKW